MKAFRRNARAVLIITLALFHAAVRLLCLRAADLWDPLADEPVQRARPEPEKLGDRGDIKDRNGVVLVTSDSDGDRVYSDDVTLRKPWPT
jgi:cell division protein FtsI/penicillin-binding protein 2